MKTFTSGDIRYIVKGVRQRHLDYWEEIGLISARGRARRPHPGGRRGENRIYSLDDLKEIRLIKQFREAGISLQHIGKALAALRTQKRRAALSKEVLVTDGKKIEWKRSDGKIIDLTRKNQLVFAVVALGNIESELRAEIHKYEKRLFKAESGIKKIARA